ncbi:Peptidase family M48 [Lishizhenia tianjinensis]|uniref:Peptidase family M48 n=1 Tax=Lishizhenia tianjinensis TaxID=477690 RepID=A0A1I6ZWG7_9FLAO|nr:M48 family metalloprotease [Lishizhenia tianjinensis]SFT66986.1 Peptidase family M48 [Lishizhenia tianjinensis]
MKRFLKNTIAISTVALTLSACGTSGGGINLFTVDQDKELGAQVAAEIDGNPAEYPVLDSASNPKPYQYLYKMRDKILNSGAVTHKNEFGWRLRIIHDDNTLNAFCTPGGYIYVYTGLMKYLDSEDQLAGVMGHEIGHADLRHSTRQMTKLHGIDFLLNVIAGDRQAIKQVTAGLIGLKFSRSHETEADEASVKYLCPTDYNAAGGASFFEKLQAEGAGGTPEFLSTHPSPTNRIEDFYNTKTTLGCSGEKTYETEYKRMLSTLP